MCASMTMMNDSLMNEGMTTTATIISTLFLPPLLNTNDENESIEINKKENESLS
jgi:hypothetical protein